MAVKLRLKRMGSKKKPVYRIVAIDSHTKRDGEYIELVGTYNPLTEPKTVKVNEETNTLKLRWETTYCGQFDLFYGPECKTIVVESLF